MIFEEHYIMSSSRDQKIYEVYVIRWTGLVIRKDNNENSKPIWYPQPKGGGETENKRDGQIC